LNKIENENEKYPETQTAIRSNDKESSNDYDESSNDYDDEYKRRERMLLFNSKDGYLIGSQIHKQTITYEEGAVRSTRHKYDNLIEPCEECETAGAAWRCLDCTQIYCWRCLIGEPDICS
jgi:hypothetical protein